MIVAAAALVALASFGLSRAALVPKPRPEGTRLDQIRLSGGVEQDADERSTIGERVVGPLVSGILSLLAAFLPARLARHYEHQLLAAGRPVPTETFIAFLVAGPLLGGLLGLMFVSDAQAPGAGMVLLTVGGGIGMGLAGPLTWLNGKKTRRQAQLGRELPDALDLIVVSVEAGLSLEAAMARIADDADTALGREFRRVLADMNLGMSRKAALQGLALRTQVPAVRSLVSAILQADQTGMGIGQVLRAQAVHLRTQRKQRAQEAAMKAPLKMLFPLIFFIFPSLFVVILGPAVLSFLNSTAK